jgi:hypothetical protein
MANEDSPRHAEWRLGESWGDVRQPRSRLEAGRDAPEPGDLGKAAPRATLRDDVALHRIQTLHTPFKAVAEEEYRRLEKQAAHIERRFVTDRRVREYAQEVYAHTFVKRKRAPER